MSPSRGLPSLQGLKTDLGEFVQVPDTSQEGRREGQEAQAARANSPERIFLLAYVPERHSWAAPRGAAVLSARTSHLGRPDTSGRAIENKDWDLVWDGITHNQRADTWNLKAGFDLQLCFLWSV
jgi:hypothetical protein